MDRQVLFIVLWALLGAVAVAIAQYGFGATLSGWMAALVVTLFAGVGGAVSGTTLRQVKKTSTASF